MNVSKDLDNMIEVIQALFAKPNAANVSSQTLKSVIEDGKGGEYSTYYLGVDDRYSIHT